MADPKPPPTQEKKPTYSIKALQLKPLYDRYAIDKQSNGETPMTYEQWVKKNTSDKE